MYAVQFIRLCIALAFFTFSNAFLRSSKVSNHSRQTVLTMSWDLATFTKLTKRALIAPLVFTLGQLPLSWIPYPSSAYAAEEISLPTRVLRTGTGAGTAESAVTDSESKQVEVYFGVGCFGMCNMNLSVSLMSYS